jgi:iron complex outermembrane recepter protein
MKYLFAATAMTALVASAIQAQAQTAPKETEASDGLTEITVTARKTAENLQDVPVAVTALLGDQLADQSVRALPDLQQVAPNLRIRMSNSNPSSALVTIRGQSQNDTVATLDPAVGVYVDGVYWARSVGLSVNILDVATAEILRGPQGTLFGRNTTGGALNITTADPDLNDLQVRAGVTLANYGTLNLSGAVSIPVIAGKLAIRIAAQDNSTNGFGYNLFNKQQTDDLHTTTFRAKALLQVTDDLSLLLGTEIFKLDGRGPGQKLVFGAATSPGNVVIRRLSGGRESLATYLNDGKAYITNTDASEPAIAKSDTEYAVISLSTGIGDFKATGSRRRVFNSYTLDFDGTPYPIGAAQPSEADTTQYTGEVNYSNAFMDDRLKVILGYFYFYEDGTDKSFTNVLALLNPVNNPSQPFGFITARSHAVYGQANFKLTGALTFTGGIRYTNDTKGFSSQTRNGIGTDLARCQVPVITRPDPTKCFGVFPDVKATKVNYLASLDYKIGNDALVYARTATGYRSGGYNLRGTINPLVAGPYGTFTAFGPESVTNYELGFKSELFDRHLRLNVALFYDQFDDVQRTTVVATPSGGVATYATNAAKATVKGIEAEGTLLLGSSFAINFAAGYTDAKYKTYIDPILGDLSAAKFPNTPEFTGNIGGEYKADVGIGELKLRADYSYVTKVNFTGAPALVRGINLADIVTEPGYGLLNLRASLQPADDRLEISVFGTNVTNKLYYVSAHEFVTSGLGIVNKIPGRPAQYGVELKFKY